MTTTLIRAAVPLSITFDTERLVRDLDAAETCERRAQPGGYHDGTWVGISLRSPGGVPTAHPSLPSYARYADCDILHETPYLREVLARVPAPVLCARLLYLPPGGVIREHSDDLLGWWHGLVRLHIPIQTSEEVEFRIDGARYHMRPGELWYGDFSRTHSVHNRWDRTRVHLVIDAAATPALAALFPPTFLALHAPALTFTPEIGSVDASMLQRFETRIVIPGAVVGAFRSLILLSTRDVERVDRAITDGIECELIVLDDELVAVVAGRRILRLEPIDDGTLKICDWSAGILLHFVEPSKVVLELRMPSGPRGADHGQLIALRVLPR